MADEIAVYDLYGTFLLPSVFHMMEHSELERSRSDVLDFVIVASR